MESLTRTRKIGGSIMVTVPREIVRAENIHENELVKIDVKKVRKSYRGALKGIGSFTREDELDTHD